MNFRNCGMKFYCVFLVIDKAHYNNLTWIIWKDTVIYSWKKFISTIMSCLNFPVPKFVLKKVQMKMRTFACMIVGDFILVKIFAFWWQNFDIGNIYWRWLPVAYVKRLRMLVTKTVKTVTNISKLSPIHFVSNIRHKHRCSRTSNFRSSNMKLFLYLSNCSKIVLTYNPDYKSCNVPSSN